MFDYSSYDATKNEEIAGMIYRAINIKSSSIDLDSVNSSAVMQSSKQDHFYHVTLSSCTCPSFNNWNNKIPCKHMFRLAMELGIELNFPMLDPVSGSKYRPSSDLKILHERWINGQITFEAYKACKTALEKSVRYAKKLKKENGM